MLIAPMLAQCIAYIAWMLARITLEAVSDTPGLPIFILLSCLLYMDYATPSPKLEHWYSTK